MRERDVRKMLRQDVRGPNTMRPLDEFVVTRVRQEADPEMWSFSWDGATLQLPPSDTGPTPGAITLTKK
jgi:hypothetical protein